MSVYVHVVHKPSVLFVQYRNQNIINISILANYFFINFKTFHTIEIVSYLQVFFKQFYSPLLPSSSLYPPLLTFPLPLSSLNLPFTYPSTSSFYLPFTYSPFTSLLPYLLIPSFACSFHNSLTHPVTPLLIPFYPSLFSASIISPQYVIPPLPTKGGTCDIIMRPIKSLQRLMPQFLKKSA